MIRILGIDPGLAHTGWGVIAGDGRRLHYIAHGTILTDRQNEPADRLYEIYSAVSEIISVHTPQIVGVETLYFAKNRTSAIPVAEARGSVLVAVAKNGIHCYSYTPLEIKQSLTGNGRAEKHQVQEMVRILLGLSEVPTPDHAADALAAAICTYHMHQFSDAMEKDISSAGGRQ